jgi:hypothetical protein
MLLMRDPLYLHPHPHPHLHLHLHLAAFDLVRGPEGIAHAGV